MKEKKVSNFLARLALYFFCCFVICVMQSLFFWHLTFLEGMVIVASLLFAFIIIGTADNCRGIEIKLIELRKIKKIIQTAEGKDQAVFISARQFHWDDEGRQFVFAVAEPRYDQEAVRHYLEKAYKGLRSSISEYNWEIFAYFSQKIFNEIKILPT